MVVTISTISHQLNEEVRIGTESVKYRYWFISATHFLLLMFKRLEPKGSILIWVPWGEIISPDSFSSHYCNAIPHSKPLTFSLLEYDMARLLHKWLQNPSGYIGFLSCVINRSIDRTQWNVAYNKSNWQNTASCHHVALSSIWWSFWSQAC